MLESYLISIAIKVTALLAAGHFCLRFLRRSDAAVRHSVCLAALASGAAVPLLVLWSPNWSFRIAVPASASALPAAHGVVAPEMNWPLAIALVWAAGAIVLALRAAGGWILLIQTRRQSVSFGHRNGMDIRVGDVGTPLVCGVLRPLILLPESARGWDELRLRAVLLHETAHLLRRDCAAKYLAQAARALLWWNPLAWIMAARLNREQELACDEAVLAGGVSAETYANLLMDMVRECKGPLVFGCAMANGAALRERFTNLFEQPRRSASRARMPIAIPALLLLLTTVSFAEKIYKVGPGIVPPMVIEKHDPVYPEKEKKTKIQGTVKLLIVVGTDQLVHEVKVTKSVTRALDASAIAAIRTWKFQPGTKNGKPVPVRATIEVNFHLL